MAKLIVTRGLPGCGKSTAASGWVRMDPDKRMEVNRDAIRLMLGGFVVGSAIQEKMVTKVSHTSIHDLLASGIDVVCSDTNLQMKYMRELYRIAASVGAEVEVWDMTNVPLDVVLYRNKNRTDKDPVPESVIRRMYASNIKGKGYPLGLPEPDSAGKSPDPFVAALDTPRAIIVDIDGTVASCDGVRSPYDYSRVYLDDARRGIIDIVRMAHRDGCKVIFVSGRPDISDVRKDTMAWIEKYVRVPIEALFMRPADRLHINDAIIKRDLFDAYIRDYYDIVFVLDDRDRVVDMWRRQLGLDCLQVNYGDF